ncbi:asparagine synthetase B [Terasakiella brassicae]|uniref:asparagine synthase (glutamine-hydrolyzing) n=1 Tax=Terasakiella brassicae TaxID=1634917 RepID=A0A917FBX5_9PROT|nr:asparagine synthase (glutamine-hydrolyzing) [Terasakiella brassicae]GGF64442.1 asparagine synthetase B [Terasakiella brassicae]
MCGIAGFFGHGTQEDLKRMTNSIAHRGPDGEGAYQDDNSPVFLGHRRLSIVDLEHGQQPMTNTERSVWVTFNGEIYNHRELRHDLETKGYKFNTPNSDTEVLVHGWQEWGEELPLKLNGMFAFCIWDKKRETMFLARDRFGEKPLFWGHQKDLFVFGSEISVFQAHNSFDTAYSQLALKKYFAYAFIPAPFSAFENCYKLKPGHSLTFNVRTQAHKITPYWQFRIEVPASPPSFEEAAEELETLFVQAVKRRLMSDVPLGAFLSGGVDSSSVLAAMCRISPAQSVQSFAIGFTEKSFDESAYAREMAASLGCKHHEEILDLTKARSIIPDVLTQLDEPMADGSLLPTYLLCQFARKHVKVALSGDAGDELFAGYDPFKALQPANVYQQFVPKFMHQAAKSLIDLLPMSNKNMSLDFKLRRVLMGLDHPRPLWLPTWMAPLQTNDICDLFNAPTNAEELYAETLDLWNESPNKSQIDKSLEYFTNFYLPDDILTKVDRASMMNGLEARAVFLDCDLVEFVRRLPCHYKFDGKTTKKVLKKAVSRLVPDTVLNRRKKGFGVPLMTWMKEIPLNAKGADNFQLNSNNIETYISQHLSGQKDYRFFLWNWLVLQKSKASHL